MEKSRLQDSNDNPKEESNGAEQLNEEELGNRDTFFDAEIGDLLPVLVMMTLAIISCLQKYPVDLRSQICEKRFLSE
ncbi:unnamed protein product [Nezara viridula]|uniref:Uncharacterized protein n=1 Tax=Nezara viridula TaxID=85310 RepID=A0A9P0H2U8_NEZVI|nr:unnamed protein product [Nezara viridula]